MTAPIIEKTYFLVASFPFTVFLIIFDTSISREDVRRILKVTPKKIFAYRLLAVDETQLFRGTTTVAILILTEQQHSTKKQCHSYSCDRVLLCSFVKENGNFKDAFSKFSVQYCMSRVDERSFKAVF